MGAEEDREGVVEGVGLDQGSVEVYAEGAECLVGGPGRNLMRDCFFGFQIDVQCCWFLLTVGGAA